MKLWISLLFLATAAATAREDGPAKTLAFPDKYREWVWLSSGVGMSYTPGDDDKDPAFDNVFASPEAYKGFQATGTWPNGTILVLEVRKSASKGSINVAGHYQTQRAAVETHVKDDQGRWLFYGFGNGGKKGTLIPKEASCYSCHEQHAAVDTTFVQFYPTLLEVAKTKGTVRQQ